MKVLDENDVIQLLPKRKSASHKGENGRVLIISGSAIYSGAAILAGMGALHSGADLIKIFVPEENVEAVRSHSPEFIVRGFSGKIFESKFIPEIQDWIEEADCILAGMGSEHKDEFISGVKDLLKIPGEKFVLDSNAIFALEEESEDVLITPHATEFKEFSWVAVNALITGATDKIISNGGEVVFNKTGSSGMTVGGSGDVLAGVCGGLIAQGLTPFDAAKVGAYFLGKTGEKLEKTKGFSFSAEDLATELSFPNSQNKSS